MKFEIQYQQTPHERYDTPMNQDVRSVLETAGIKIVEEYGGSELGGDMNELIAEAAFVVETTTDELAKVADTIQGIVGREVKVDEALADEEEV